MKFSSVAATVSVGFTAATALDFNLIHINDMHARVEGMAGVGGCSPSEKEANKCDGGWARLLTAAQSFAEESATAGVPLVFVDNGDQFSGTVWSSFYKGEEVSTFKNLFCEILNPTLCLSGIGNHEFDFGYQAILDTVKNVNHDYICANIVDNCAENSQGVHAEGELGSLIKKSVVVDIGGTPVTFIGTVTRETATTSSPPKCLEFLDEKEAILAELANVETDIVILNSHSGLQFDLEVAAEFPDIDIIVGGHSHSFLWNTATQGDVPLPSSGGDPDTPHAVYPSFAENDSSEDHAVLQVFTGSRYLGAISLSFDEAGVLVAYEAKSVLVGDAASDVAEEFKFESNPEILDLEDVMIAPLLEFINAPVAELEHDLSININGTRRVRHMEMPIGNFACDAMLAEANKLDPDFVQLCMQNSGGIRTSLDAGNVTFGEVIEVFPFSNVISIVSMTGAQVRAAAERGVAVLGGGSFLQYGAGFSLVYNPDEEVGSRIVSIEYDGVEILDDDSQTFNVVTNSFMAGGGDGFEVFLEAEVILLTGANQEDVLRDHIIANPDFCPSLDGRVTPTFEYIDENGFTVPALTAKFACSPEDPVDPAGADVGLIVVLAIIIVAILVVMFIMSRPTGSKPAAENVDEEQLATKELQAAEEAHVSTENPIAEVEK